MSRKKSILLVVVALLILVIVFWPAKKATSPPSTNTESPTTSANTKPPATFDKKLYSTTDPASVWVVVNKKHPLTPINYVPVDLTAPNVPLRVPGNESMQLRKITITALEQLFTAAKSAGFSLMLSSGYRSYSYQVSLYNGYVHSVGQVAADAASARPGHSEHQTGLAADVEPTSHQCEVDACFGNLPEGKWLATNAYKFGFIIRYPADKVSITGYEYEPWHIRYVGASLSEEMHKTGVKTLEEFFDISGGNY